MRQKIKIDELTYKESFDGIDFEPYPSVPDELTPFIVRANADKRIYKMMHEQPEIMEYSLTEIIEDEEDDEEIDYSRIIHPGLAVYIDELRVAGFCRVETPLTEYITPQTDQVYIPVEPYNELLGNPAANISPDDAKPS